MRVELCWQQSAGESAAHSRAMKLIDKILGLLVAVFTASWLAIALGYVAHYGFGLSRLEIRMSALTGAAIFGLIFAMLATTDRFNPRKSK